MMPLKTLLRMVLSPLARQDDSRSNAAARGDDLRRAREQREDVQHDLAHYPDPATPRGPSPERPTGRD